MDNKCPNCGYNYSEFDVFCAKCGKKIERQETTKEIDADKNEVLNKTIESFAQNFNTKKQEYFNPNAKNIFNNPLISYTIFIFGILLVFSLLINFIITKQYENKLKLQYKHVMSKPVLIPQLKEPKNFSELSTNLAKVEQFLSLYLKYSTDSYDKKEQIFTNYIDEISKLPHLSSENMQDEKIKICNGIKNVKQAKNCTRELNKEFKNLGIKAYNNQNSIFIYPDDKKIYEKYAKYLKSPLKNYIKLKSQYEKPTTIGLIVQIPAKSLAQKIYKWEKIYNTTNHTYIKENSEILMYDDFKNFIFNPEIYATTTKEMKKSYKKAYNYFIKTKKDSNLKPVVMSYLDKQKNYSEENFKNDYPYKTHEKTFVDNVEKSILQDVFSQLRNSVHEQTSDKVFKYVYNTVTNEWSNYQKDLVIKPYEYALTDISENNNVSIYNSSLSLFQEINIPKYSNLFIVNKRLYIYNCDKLSISKINFNSESFNTTQMGVNDITSIFPGVNVIDIDNYSSYNILIEKDNARESFIILSKYSQGWQKYILKATKGSIRETILPNMFVVDTNQETNIALYAQGTDPQEMSENSPVYTFIIRTRGQARNQGNYQQTNESQITQYDKKTQEEANDEQKYKPVFKPKIGENDHKIFEDKTDEDLLTAPPTQNLEPPEDDD